MGQEERVHPIIIIFSIGCMVLNGSFSIKKGLKFDHRVPVIAQYCDNNGKIISAEELTLPAARPVKFWAFSRMGSQVVINIECAHRHHPENGVYSFRVKNDKIVCGGASDSICGACQSKQAIPRTPSCLKTTQKSRTKRGRMTSLRSATTL